jgi:opacity protein-like surface antigen
MLRSYATSLAVLAAAIPVSSALAEDGPNFWDVTPRSGFYVGGSVGADSLPNISANVNGFDVTSSWKTGYAVMLNAGYKWDFGLRTEIEYSYRDDKVKAFNFTSPWEGTQWDNSLMINLLYEVPTGIALRPYFGAGGGGSHINWGDNFRNRGPVIYDGTDTKFAWQAMIGVAYAVTPSVDLTVDYRIKTAESYTFRGSFAGTYVTDFNERTRTLSVGARYTFGDGVFAPVPEMTTADGTEISAPPLAGPYVSAGAGPDFKPDIGLNIDGSHATSTWKTGYGLFLAAGYKWDFGLRVEGEYSYRQATVRTFNTNIWYGSHFDNSAMLNVLYDVPTGTNFIPYIGFGGGGSHISWADNFRAIGSPFIYDGSGIKFAYQGIVGIAYAITPRIDLTVDYRYKGAESYTFHGSVQNTAITDFNERTQSVFVGLRYSFGSFAAM